ncbi:MAG: hypothetical protein ACK4UY_16485 [Dietzia sp.]
MHFKFKRFMRTTSNRLAMPSPDDRYTETGWRSLSIGDYHSYLQARQLAITFLRDGGKYEEEVRRAIGRHCAGGVWRCQAVPVAGTVRHCGAHRLVAVAVAVAVACARAQGKRRIPAACTAAQGSTTPRTRR